MFSETGFTPVGSVVSGTLKEVLRRVELRWRLEAERGGPIDDREFL